jgi:hypothetical protein
MEGKMIGNVNVLDLRKATEASLAGIGKIGNVNVMICSPATSGLVTRLSVGNVNATVTAPDDVMVKTNYFSNLKEKILPVCIGQTIFEQDVTAEDIQNGLYGFVAIGQVICPERLLGAVQAKADKLIGQTRTYPALDKVLFTSLVIDESTLEAMSEGTELAVIGSVTLPDVLPNDLLERKLAKLFVFGDTQCHAENARAIKTRLMAGSGSVKTIPEGYEWVADALHLDSGLLEMWVGKKVYGCDPRGVGSAPGWHRQRRDGLGASGAEEGFLEQVRPAQNQSHLL